MISGKQNAASTAATPERLVWALNLDRRGRTFRVRRAVVFCWNIEWLVIWGRGWFGVLRSDVVCFAWL